MTKLRRTRWLAGLGALALLLAPRIAEACAVCMGNQEEETRTAFILTTVFLSVLPILGVGAMVWWLRRRARELAAEEFEPAPAPAQRRAARA